jgi:hypothetical protein
MRNPKSRKQRRSKNEPFHSCAETMSWQVGIEMTITHLDTVQRVPMMPLYGTRAADQLSPEAIIAPYGWQ